MRDADHSRFEFLYGQTPDPSKPSDVFGYLDPSGEVSHTRPSSLVPNRSAKVSPELRRAAALDSLGSMGHSRLSHNLMKLPIFEDGLAVVSRDENSRVSV